MSNDLVWKVGALLFAIGAPLLTILMTLLFSIGIEPGWMDARNQAFLQAALVSFAMVVGIAYVWRRRHGEEASILETFLLQLGCALSLILLFGAASNRFALVSYGRDMDRYLFGGLTWGTILVIALFSYQFWQRRGG